MSDYRLDWFMDPSRKLYQNPEHFCFNTDTRLLAGFMQIRKGESILDIGCNNGALLYACDVFDVGELVGVEIFDEACTLARLNVETFFSHPAKIVNCPIQEYEDEPFDVIVSNPPYFKQEATHPDVQIDARQLGRIEANLTFEQLVQSVSRLLKSSGRFYFVHRPNRLNDFFYHLQKCNFSVKTLQFAMDRGVVKSVLIEAVKERKCDCTILQPVIIR